MKKKGKKKCFVLLALLALSCTRTEIVCDPGGAKTFKRSSFLQRIEVGTIKISPDGTASLSGYKNDGGNEALAAAVSAAVTAAVQSATPVP